MISPIAPLPVPVAVPAMACHLFEPPRTAQGAPLASPALRPVRADDAHAFQRFVMQLSPVSRRMRFHAALNGCSPALLRALTQPDPALHRAWVAVQGFDGQESIVGEARFVIVERGRHSAELALAVADAQRGRGLADRLMATLLQAAERASIQVLFGDVLENNVPMRKLLRRHGFEARHSAGAGLVRWRRQVAYPTSARIDRWPTKLQASHECAFIQLNTSSGGQAPTR